MKHLYYLAALLLLPLSFASCTDDDTREAIMLSGSWSGDFGMYYIENYHGREYRYDCYDTDLYFEPAFDYATRGIGREYDYYSDPRCPVEYTYFFFRWEIRDGIIYLTYPHDPQLNTRLSNYRLSSNWLTGVFVETGTSFRLRKIEDYYQGRYWWEDYTVYDNDRYGYWHEWERSGWTRSGGFAPADGSDSTSVATDNEERTIQYGRRY